MSGAGGMMIDGVTDGVNRTMKDAMGGPQMRLPVERGGPQMGMPVERGNPIDQPIFGFNPMPSPDVMPPDWRDTMPYDPMPDPGFGGGKSGMPTPDPIGIDPSPIQGGGNGGGANGPGLDHLKDYGPVVDQMKQYVQSMSGLIDQINSKF